MAPDQPTLIRKCMYVDMSNLYGGMSELLAPGEYFDFSTLMPLINREFGGIDQFKVYGAYMGLEKATNPNDELFIKAQNEFFNSAKLPKVHFGQGNISKHGQEKGVDMQLDVDMVNDAHLNKFSDVILFSGDADFNYPVAIIKGMGKAFHYCSFATRHSNHMAWQAWRKVTLDHNRHFATRVLPSLKLPSKHKVYELSSNPAIKIKRV